MQADILAMPFKENSFDFIFSEGVLHHTPNPREAFHKCCSVLRKGGEIAFYVYRKKGPAREFTDDYLRTIVHGLPASKQWDFADRITQLGKALSEVRTVVDIPVAIPELGIAKGKIDVQRLLYWNFLKCFWNDELPFEENRLVNFDWFTPEHAYRFTEQEIRDWCRGEGVEITWFHSEESGYTVRGSKAR
jgi:SAM-dependent methyltransferase